MKNKINIVFTLSILSAIISAGLYFYLYTRLLNNETKAVSLYNKLVESEKTLGDLEKIEKNLNTTISENDKLNVLFVKSDAVVDFIQKVESIFKELDVSGEVSSVSEEKFTLSEGNEQERLLVALSVGGDWNGLLKLVGLLERLPYKSTIEGITLTSAKKETKSIDSKDVVTTKEWGLKVRMYVWLTPKKPNVVEVKAEEVTPTQNDESR